MDLLAFFTFFATVLKWTDGEEKYLQRQNFFLISFK